MLGISGAVTVGINCFSIRGCDDFDDSITIDIVILCCWRWRRLRSGSKSWLRRERAQGLELVQGLEQELVKDGIFISASDADGEVGGFDAVGGGWNRSRAVSPSLRGSIAVKSGV